METAEVRQAVERLSGSVWAFSALDYAAETGMLEQLSEPRTMAYVSERTGVTPILVERIFDVLASLNLVQRQGEMFTADKGLIPLVSPPGKNYFLASLRASHFQSYYFAETAQKPASSIGWNFTEPPILQSQGLISAAGMDSSLKQMVSRLDGLAARLQSSSARSLDIGVGVGALSIAVCRALPNLHVVGIDTQDAPLTEARRNIAAAGLADRIELRKQGIEDLTDKEVFDYVFFPQSFMPDAVVRRGLTNIWRALRPGGWLTVATMCIPGTDLQATLSRLRDTLWGGGGRVPSQVEAMMTDAGYASIRVSEVPGMPTFRGIVGRRPA
jgi:predicted O-methyltransferase YrrM